MSGTLGLLSSEEFGAECLAWVELSDRLGDGWRLEQGVQGCYLRRLATQALQLGVQEGWVQVGCEWEVHYSLAYSTPLLLARFSHPTGEPLSLEEVWGGVVPPGAGAWDRVSPAPHPVTGLPWIQVHPCRTAEVTGLLLGQQCQGQQTQGQQPQGQQLQGQQHLGQQLQGQQPKGQHSLNQSPIARPSYLVAFLSLYGQGLGLRVSEQYARQPPPL